MVGIDRKQRSDASSFKQNSQEVVPRSPKEARRNDRTRGGAAYATGTVGCSVSRRSKAPSSRLESQLYTLEQVCMSMSRVVQCENMHPPNLFSATCSIVQLVICPSGSSQMKELCSWLLDRPWSRLHQDLLFCSFLPARPPSNEKNHAFFFSRDGRADDVWSATTTYSREYSPSRYPEVPILFQSTPERSIWR